MVELLELQAQLLSEIATDHLQRASALSLFKKPPLNLPTGQPTRPLTGQASNKSFGCRSQNAKPLPTLLEELLRLSFAVIQNLPGLAVVQAVSLSQVENGHPLVIVELLNLRDALGPLLQALGRLSLVREQAGQWTLLWSMPDPFLLCFFLQMGQLSFHLLKACINEHVLHRDAQVTVEALESMVAVQPISLVAELLHLLVRQQSLG